MSYSTKIVIGTLAVSLLVGLALSANIAVTT
jgi:hypothetical protein